MFHPLGIIKHIQEHFVSGYGAPQKSTQTISQCHGMYIHVHVYGFLRQLYIIYIATAKITCLCLHKKGQKTLSVGGLRSALFYYLKVSEVGKHNSET